MLQFFHGWRRKAGVVTLVMALAFLWVSAQDHAGNKKMQLYAMRPENRDNFKIGDNGTVWYKVTDGWKPMANLWRPLLLAGGSLTLLSAYLILWKPRKQKTSDQTPNPNNNSN